MKDRGFDVCKKKVKEGYKYIYKYQLCALSLSSNAWVLM
jgi:hypothetical protein